MNDTTPETAALVHARLIARSGEERFLMGVCMHEAARRMVLASFPAGLSASQQWQLLRDRFYGSAPDILAAEVPSRPAVRTLIRP